MALYLGSDRMAIIRIIQRDINHLPASRALAFSKMPHSRKDKGQFFLMMLGIAGFVHDFGHQDNICFCHIFKRGDILAQLIT